MRNKSCVAWGSIQTLDQFYFYATLFFHVDSSLNAFWNHVQCRKQYKNMTGPFLLLLSLFESELNCVAWGSIHELFQMNIPGNCSATLLSLLERELNCVAWDSMYELFHRSIPGNRSAMERYDWLCAFKSCSQLLASKMQLSKSQTKVITPASFVADRACFCDINEEVKNKIYTKILLWYYEEVATLP